MQISRNIVNGIKSNN